MGQDPIIVASRAAVTEPFVDFAVEHLSRLSLTRTYTSADASVRGGPRGVLGRGWHHEWEGTLSCEGTTCTVSFGASGGMQFGPPAQAASLDGAETWDIYPALHVTGVPQQHRNVLARHPNGVWTLFLTDGRQLEFAVVCDACTSAEATGTLCSDPRTGGRARLTKVVDPAGNAVAVAYDRPAGVLLTVSDGLGHTLELRGADACGAGLAETLRFDGSIVATYTFASDDLARVVDADGHVLRSYVYVTGFGGLLQAVQDEAGGPLAEFSYDALGRAVGIADARTSASVEYRTDGSVAVTEYYRGPAGDTSTTHVRQLDRYGRVTSVTEGCACGEARTFDWMGPNLSCSRDSSGHIEYRQLDALGRVSRRIEYSGTACPTAPPSSLPPDSRTQRRLGAPSRRGSRSSSTEWT